jgi:hypothetical protein
MKNSEKPTYPIVGIAFDDNHKGLTKREYFAAMAMQGLLARHNYLSDEDVVSRNAVDYADALLAELEKPQP